MFCYQGHELEWMINMHGISFFSYFCKSLNVRIKVRQWCKRKGDRRCLNDVLYSKWLNLRWILKQLWCVLCFTAASPSRRFDLNSIKHRFTFQRPGPRNLPPASSNERLHQMNPFSPPLPRFSFVIFRAFTLISVRGRLQLMGWVDEVFTESRLLW